MSLITDLENIANTSSFPLDVTAATALLQIKRKWDRGDYNGNHMQTMEDIGTTWKSYYRDLYHNSSPNKAFWIEFHNKGRGGHRKFHLLCLEQPPPA